MSRYYLKEEIYTLISIRPQLLDEIEAEGLVAPEEGNRYSLEALEQLRVIRNLVDELGVNLAGAEIILQMREEIRQLHVTFDQILREAVARIPRR